MSLSPNSNEDTLQSGSPVSNATHRTKDDHFLYTKTHSDDFQDGHPSNSEFHEGKENLEI